MLPAIFLNAVFCTTAAHTTCMPAQFSWTAPPEKRNDQRAELCKTEAAKRNKAIEGASMFYRCDVTKGA